MIRNQLSHIVGIHSIGFIMCGTYKIRYLHGPINDVDGEILLLPVRVRHVENARAIVAYITIYSCVANNIRSYDICHRYMRVS